MTTAKVASPPHRNAAIRDLARRAATFAVGQTGCRSGGAVIETGGGVAAACDRKGLAGPIGCRPAAGGSPCGALAAPGAREAGTDPGHGGRLADDVVCDGDNSAPDVGDDPAARCELGTQIGVEQPVHRTLFPLSSTSTGMYVPHFGHRRDMLRLIAIFPLLKGRQWHPCADSLAFDQLPPTLNNTTP